MASENGWEPAQAGPDQCEWKTVPGTNVTLQLLKGQPSILLPAWAADWNAYIELLRDADSAGWTPTNAVPTSNHLNGTAIDLNWDSHPFRNRGSLNADQLQTMSEMEEFYEGTVFWAGRWDDPVDEMHSQMGYDSYNNLHTQDFINRKIRPDGFSTFRRGAAASQPQVSGKDQVALFIIKEGQRRGYTRDEIIACVSTGIQESSLDQDATDSTGHRGVYQQDGSYSNRETIEGNINGFFERLDAKRHSLGASPDIWKNIFWLQQRPGEPSADAAFDNGRQAYLTEIQSRIAAATDFYNRLAGAAPTPIPTIPSQPGEIWMPDASIDQMIRDIHQALFMKLPSKSRYGDPAILWTVLELIRNDDGFWFDDIVERNALRGDQWSQVAIEKAAARGDPLATQFYNEHASGHRHPPQPQPTATAAPPPPSSSPQPSDVASINTTIMALAAQMQQLKQLIAAAIG